MSHPAFELRLRLAHVETDGYGDGTSLPDSVAQSKRASWAASRAQRDARIQDENLRLAQRIDSAQPRIRPASSRSAAAVVSATNGAAGAAGQHPSGPRHVRHQSALAASYRRSLAMRSAIDHYDARLRPGSTRPTSAVPRPGTPAAHAVASATNAANAAVRAHSVASTTRSRPQSATAPSFLSAANPYLELMRPSGSAGKTRPSSAPRTMPAPPSSQQQSQQQQPSRHAPSRSLDLRRHVGWAEEKTQLDSPYAADKDFDLEQLARAVRAEMQSNGVTSRPASSRMPRPPSARPTQSHPPSSAAVQHTRPTVAPIDPMAPLAVQHARGGVSVSLGAFVPPPQPLPSPMHMSMHASPVYSSYTPSLSPYPPAFTPFPPSPRRRNPSWHAPSHSHVHAPYHVRVSSYGEVSAAELARMADASASPFGADEVPVAALPPDEASPAGYAQVTHLRPRSARYQPAVAVEAFADGSKRYSARNAQFIMQPDSGMDDDQFWPTGTPPPHPVHQPHATAATTYHAHVHYQPSNGASATRWLASAGESATQRRLASLRSTHLSSGRRRVVLQEEDHHQQPFATTMPSLPLQGWPASGPHGEEERYAATVQHAFGEGEDEHADGADAEEADQGDENAEVDDADDYSYTDSPHTASPFHQPAPLVTFSDPAPLPIPVLDHSQWQRQQHSARHAAMRAAR